MKRRLYVLGALAVALIAIRAALPTVLEALIARQGTLALGLPVSVENVDLSLHAGVLAVEGLDIGGDQAPRLHCERIVANLHFLNLFRGRAQLERLEIGRAEIALALLADGTVAPLVRSDDLGETPELTVAMPAEEAASEAGGAWPLWIDRLSIADFKLLLVTPAAPDLPPLEVTLEKFRFSNFTLIDGQLAFGSVGLAGAHAKVRRDLEFEPARATPEAASAKEAATASKGTSAQPGTGLSLDDLSIEDVGITLEARDAEVELALSASARNLRLDPDSRFPVKLRIDREGGWLKLEGEAGANPPAFAGTLSLEGLSLASVVEIIDPDIPVRIGAGTLGGRLELQLALGAEGVSAHAEGHLQIDGGDGTAGGRELELKQVRLEVTELAYESVVGGPPRIRAKSAIVDAEGLSFHDRTIEPSFLLELLTFDFTARNVRLPARDAEFDLTAKGLAGLDATANGALKGGVGRTDLALAGALLSPLAAYADGGWIEIENGTAGVAGQVSSDGPHHDFNLDLTLTDLEVGHVDPGVFQQTFGMAPDLALALLSDPSGSVTLPIHFEIDALSGDAGFSLPRLLAGALSQAAMGIVTSPLKGLGAAHGALFGDDGDLILDPVPFPPGKKKWDDDQEIYLDALARTLEARAAVHIRLTGIAGNGESERLARARAERVAGALRKRDVLKDRIELAEPTAGNPGVEIAIVPAPEEEGGESD